MRLFNYGSDTLLSYWGSLIKHRLIIYSILYLVEVGQWFIILYQHLCKLQALLWVYPHYVPQQEDVVRGKAHLLGIQNYLLELACLSKTLDNLDKKMYMQNVISSCMFVTPTLLDYHPNYMHTAFKNQGYLKNVTLIKFNFFLLNK